MPINEIANGKYRESSRFYSGEYFMKIHHIGYLVKNIDKAIESFIQLGYVVEKKTIYDTARMVDICFLNKDGYCIELVCPKDSKSPIYGLGKKCKNAPYHICYLCKDFDKTIEEWSKSTMVLFQPAEVAPALGGKRVAFFMSPTIGMIELLEE